MLQMYWMYSGNEGLQLKAEQFFQPGHKITMLSFQTAPMLFKDMQNWQNQKKV